MAMFSYQRIDTTPLAIAQCTEFMTRCFPHTKIFTTQYLTWLYVDNPEGPVIGFNAWDGDRLIAHYACIPKRVKINGEPTNVILSLNTATHPDYWKKNLFIELATMTYQAASDKGYSAVIGVSNANSTYGCVNKLHFQLVQPLEARLGIGPLHMNFEQLNRNAQFQRLWSAKTLSWRCANPVNPVFRRNQEGRVLFYARAKRNISVYAEHRDYDFGASTCSDHSLSTLRLFIGLVPEGACSFRHYYPIPQRLRPSPLNFIYRSLDNKVPFLDKRCIDFSFLDFDAY